MASFFENIANKYRQGNVVLKLIFVNIAVFLLYRFLLVGLSLFKLDADFLTSFLQMPSSIIELGKHPWTIFTYMFVHLDLLHILFNMLWLYFFGGLFLRWFDAKTLTLLYIVGGFCGAFFFILFYNVLPAFSGIQALLIGASASILALAIAIAMYKPDEPIPLFLFGVVKLKWLAIIMVVMDLLSLNGHNAGGNLAHLGGAFAGLAFGLSIRKGRNPFAKMDFIERIFSFKRRSKPKMKVTYKRPTSEKSNVQTDVDQAYRDQKKAHADQLDFILDKIKQSGYDSLSSEEKRFLFDSSQRH